VPFPNRLLRKIVSLQIVSLQIVTSEIVAFLNLRAR
jgi:hypothetical protein